MNSYLIFAGLDYYPSGGADDLYDTAPTLAAAQDLERQAIKDGNHWAHIYEITTGAIYDSGWGRFK